ncbi:MAG: HAD-IA family hydrolase [archaeon]
MKLIMFDYDGVIMDSLLFLKKVYQRIADILGFELPERDEHFRELLELDWRETYRKLDILTQDKVNLSEFTYHLFSDKHNHYIKPYPDISRVIKLLSKKYQLAVVSNSFRKDITFMLKKYGLFEYFSVIFTCEDGIMKPHPDLLLKCLDHFSVAPDDAIFIGDMDGDIVAGKKAGVKTIAVTYGFHLKHRLKDADIIVSTPSELLSLLS